MNQYFEKVFAHFDLVLLCILILTTVIQVIQVYLFKVPWIGSLFNSSVLSTLIIFNAAASGKISL